VVQKRRQAEVQNVIQRSVDSKTGIELLRRLVGKADDLCRKPDLRESDIQAWETTARDFLNRTFGSESPNVNAVLHASGDGALFAGMEDEEFAEYLRSGLVNRIKILDSCIEQLQTNIALEVVNVRGANSSPRDEPDSRSSKVFLEQGRALGVKPEDVDGVTGLPMRRNFDRDFQETFARCRSEKTSLCLIMVDLDNFKQINDTYGHPKGDDVLKKVSKLIGAVVEGKGRAYRYGGEEIVILLPNFDAGEGAAVAERVRMEIGGCKIEGLPNPITASFGVATSVLADSEVHLLDYADKAMYRSKQAGKNRVTISDPKKGSEDFQAGAPRATEEEIAFSLQYLSSGTNVSTRRQAADELLHLSYRKSFSHSEDVLAAIADLLADSDDNLRLTALQLYEQVVTKADAGMRETLAEDACRRIIRVVEQDKSMVVRARAMSALGVVGNERVLDSLVTYITKWDNAVYGAVVPVVALKGLKHRFRMAIKEKLFAALATSQSDFVTKRLEECLEAIKYD
jgi:diguanylate cyclase (GGDEF)-like protein